MTKQEAIENHRKMWLWIATQTLKEKRKVGKIKYLEKVGYSHIQNECFCCEYATLCINCPIDWGSVCVYCADDNSFYTKWLEEINFKKAALYAYKISKLPENEFI